MPRLAYLLRPLARAAALAAGLGLALAPRAATASSALATYSVPQLVEILPTADTAARVVIHGVFFQLTASQSFSYSTPKCGVMYFECQAGQEAMCAMQWKELRDWKQTHGLPAMCAGFGMLGVASTAPVRAEGEPLGKPDTWDLGMGIGEGQWVDGKCPMALELQCSPPSADGGTTPGTPDATPAEPDAPANAPETGSVSPPGPSGDTDAAPSTIPPASDAGADPAPKPELLSSDRGGCSLAGGADAGAAVIGLGLLALGRARRRRR